MIAVILSFFCAFGMNYFISETLANYFFLSKNRTDYWKTLYTNSLTDFQQYVTKNQLTCKQALDSSQLVPSNSEIILYFEQFPSLDIENLEYQEFLKNRYDYRVVCTDGTIYATSYSPGKGYRTKWKTRGMIIGTISASLVLLFYIIHLLYRIKMLHHQIIRSKQGDRNTVISISGQDELFELGQIIESMRLSLWELLDQEQQIQLCQNQLVASLSHDIRTPLTKLTGYLEILIHHKSLSPKEQKEFLSKAIEKSHQLKYLTDELLNRVFVKGQMVHDTREIVNGPEFLTQIFYEGCYELEQEGFKFKLSEISGEYTLNICIDSFQRIYDNISSNIMKYASKDYPIYVNVIEGNDTISINLSNHKAVKRKDIPHHGLGLPTVKKLIEEMGGTLNIIDNKHQFKLCFTFPKTELTLSK